MNSRSGARNTFWQNGLRHGPAEFVDEAAQRRFKRAAVAPIVFVVYVLQSETTGRRYTGSCEHLDVRLAQHNAGESKSTRTALPGTAFH